ANSVKIRKVPPRSRRAVLRPAGRFFNLKHIFDELNCEYFEGRLACGITWGANKKVRNQKTIRLGSYSEATRTIRVNPVLDRRYVPNYVIRGIVYHEMLHHFLGTAGQDGGTSAHSAGFRRLERRYRHHHKLQAWLEKHREHLLGR
ncbi:MAG: SprT-like domain-containing protein, partial [Syntrophobacteria bacterium]